MAKEATLEAKARMVLLGNLECGLSSEDGCVRTDAPTISSLSVVSATSLLVKWASGSHIQGFATPKTYLVRFQAAGSAVSDVHSAQEGREG